MSNQRILNWKRQPKDERDLKSVRKLLAPKKLPASFELDLQIPVYDQGSIGSCVANSACAAYRYESAQKFDNFDFEPSRLFVYYNARKLQGWEKEDSGAYIRDGFKSLNKFGLANEVDWKYNVGKFADEPSKKAYENGLKNIAFKYAAVDQTEQAIKETLLSGAAVAFGFNVYSSFYGSWVEDTVVMPIPKAGEELLGGHAILCIGYDDAKKAFLIQNSWGENWGIGGKFWMPYSFALNKNECDDFWCIEEIKVSDKEVPPAPSNLDWKTVSTVLFKSTSELFAVKKATLIRLGVALELPVDPNKNFLYNYVIVKNHLGL